MTEATLRDLDGELLSGFAPRNEGDPGLVVNVSVGLVLPRSWVSMQPVQRLWQHFSHLQKAEVAVACVTCSGRWLLCAAGLAAGPLDLLPKSRTVDAG